jgi:hypothetical protein
VAKPTKRRIEAGKPTSSGRVTPKKGSEATSGGGSAEPTPSRRYTPPTSAAAHMPSPTWVPVLMFSFFGIGILSIFLNYSGVLPGAPSGWYLVGGLGAILAGIITATQLH